MMTINDLSVGQTAQIEKVELISPYAPRLLESGFTPGAAVTLLARAPLGEPLLLQIRRHTLLLRRCEAQLVCLKKEELL